MGSKGKTIGMSGQSTSVLETSDGDEFLDTPLADDLGEVDIDARVSDALKLVENIQNRNSGQSSNKASQQVSQTQSKE